MSAPAPTPQELAAQAAAAAAARQFNIEAFTLLGVGLAITVLRTYVRISSVGWRRLQVDDYLVWFAAVRDSSYNFEVMDMSDRHIVGMLFRRNCSSLLRGKRSAWSCQQWHDS
jgi:hypothetical protein